MSLSDSGNGREMLKRARSPASESSQTQSKRSNVAASENDSSNIRPDILDFNNQFMEPSSPMVYEASSDNSQLANYRREDIQSESRTFRQINLSQNDNQNEAASQSDLGIAQAGPQLVIWGTNVSINKCRSEFKKFIKSFTLNLSELDADEIQSCDDLIDIDIGSIEVDSSYYMKKIRECIIIGENFMSINCQHILKYNEHLYNQLVAYPQEVIPTFDMALNEIINEKYPENVSQRVYIRPYNVCKTSNIRNLNPEDINKLVTISGMVTRCSNIIAEMSIAFFECSLCHWNINVEVDRGLIAEPQICRNCDTRFSMNLVHNRSKFTDKQQIKLQEAPDDMPAGQTPYTVLLYACADLVDQIQPGERVTVTGIYRATPIRVHPRIRNVKSVYRTHIDVVHYRKIENKRLHDTRLELNLPKERIDQLIALSNLPDIYERLANSLAPNIYEHLNVKKGILLQMFGGTKNEDYKVSDCRFHTFRSEINILLCGDPGTSKSQLLQYVHNLAPRGQYTSGKGSSAVGLTAYVTKDPDTKQMVLQLGALALSDGGICCIDEFDKMNDSTRSILHEVMEQQTLSIAKAGIVCQINARTSILAAANPIGSNWNKNKTIVENIQLSPTLMSR